MTTFPGYCQHFVCHCTKMSYFIYLELSASDYGAPHPGHGTNAVQSMGQTRHRGATAICPTGRPNRSSKRHSARAELALLDWLHRETRTRRPSSPRRNPTRRRPMLNFSSKTLDELAARIGRAIEASPAKDIEKNVKVLLQGGLARLDLVTRAEFDTQAAVLLK